jgi:hypothetical protein
VDDLAGEKHPAIGKLLARLVRVIHGAIDAVAEAELAREMNGQAPGSIDEPGLTDVVDDAAVIGRRQFGLDGRLEVETLAKNNRRQLRLCRLSVDASERRVLELRRDAINGVEGGNPQPFEVETEIRLTQTSRRGSIVSRGHLRRDHRRGRRTEPGAHLSANHAEHQAGSGGDADPRRRDPAIGRVTFARSIVPGERDDARRLIELLEPAENLRLLQRQTFGCEGGVGRVDARDADVIHPPAEIDGAIGADVAPIEMRRPVAGQERVDERALREMSSTEKPVTEPHD